MGEILAAGRAAGFDLLNLCVWVKSNGGMGSLYRSRHELVFVFRNGKEGHLNNVQLGRFGRNRTNVWNYAGANSFPRKGDGASPDSRLCASGMKFTTRTAGDGRCINDKAAVLAFPNRAAERKRLFEGHSYRRGIGFFHGRASDPASPQRRRPDQVKTSATYRPVSRSTLSAQASASSALTPRAAW
jgi:hypothetical protein